MAEKPLHPVLVDLQLNMDPVVMSAPSALDVLNYFLIETNAVSAEAVRSAHSALLLASAKNAAVEGIFGKRGTKEVAQGKSPQQKSQKEQKKPNEAAAATPPPPRPPFRRRHVALRIYYDGGAYSGLAENVGTPCDASIERALFTALVRARLVTGRDDCGYSRCGRTDKGVSAAGQVIALHIKSAFALEAMLRDPTDDAMVEGADVVRRCLENKDLPKNSHEELTVWVPPKQTKLAADENAAKKWPWVQKVTSEYEYDKILNNLLPPDIRVLGWSPVTEDFSARFSCTTRTYRYFFVPRTSMKLDLMRQGLQLMVGSHDFRNFCKMDVEKVYNFERKIHSAEIVTVDKDTCYMSIVGQAFLWHQIRCIAHVLFLIGRSLEEPSIVSELLDVEKHPGKPSYALADERPLVLHDCQYSNLKFGYSVQNLWNIVCQQEQQWEDFALAAARVRNCIENLQDATVLTGELSDFCASKLKQLEKKKKGNKVLSSTAKSGDGELRLLPHFSSVTVTWRDALVWLKEQGLTPEPGKTTEFVYTPLLKRSRGTTYEEKVAALQNSSKRRQKYEDNVIKKRKTKEEDADFYEHKAKQGGSAL